MSEPADRKREDFPPDLPPREIELLAAMAETLEDSRPLPRPEFRGELRRRLAGGRPRPAKARQARWQPAAASYAVLGTTLLALAAVGLTGVGPFGA